MTTPRFTELPPLLVAGLREPLNEQSSETIPLLWKNFIPYFGKVPHQLGKVAYGLCVRSSDSSNGVFYYMAGCEVSEFNDIPEALSPLIVPAHKYVVFTHNTHLSEIKNTIHYAFDEWLPNSTYKHDAQSIHFFERYGEGFDPESGYGDIEIWVPLKF